MFEEVRRANIIQMLSTFTQKLIDYRFREGEHLTGTPQQRYVCLDSFEYVTPPELEGDAEAMNAFIQAMDAQAREYCRIAALLKDKHINSLMQQGMDKKEAVRKAEKMAIEDARFVLPNACTTKMIVTMNARSLNNFFRHRCCNRAQWEIRELAEEMLWQVRDVAPTLLELAGPPCVKGLCPEGKMSCGKAAEMKQRYLSHEPG